jgi:predicted Zn finger-like uncharacterized protein
MTSQVTQCPKCHTSFRVTDTQLNIAGGAVRCGSCLHIFNAPDHWLDDITNPVLKTVSTSDEFDDEQLFNDTGEQQALDQIFEDGDDFPIDDRLELDLGYEEKHEEEALTEELMISDVPHSDAIQEEGIFDDDEDDNDGDILIDDDTLIDDNTPLYDDTDSQPTTIVEEGMLSEEDLNISPHSNNASTGEYSDTFLDLDTWEEDPASIFKELDDLGEANEASESNEDEWAERLLEEESEIPLTDDEPEPFEETPEIFDAIEEPEPPPIDSDLLDILEEDDNPAMLTVTEDEFVLGNEPMLAGDPIGDNNYSLLANIEPEPVVMRVKQQRNHWKKRGWAAAIVIALLALSLQYLSTNFDRLSRDTTYRPILASACTVVGCQLPNLDDVRQILSSNLMVRSHPDIKNALVVDAIITNRANFKQSFPVMELQFTDLEGKVVAGRRFTPKEYLAGELTGVSLMPTRQPIHISLEIVDPGQKAVNYQLYFHSQRDG